MARSTSWGGDDLGPDRSHLLADRPGSGHPVFDPDHGEGLRPQRKTAQDIAREKAIEAANERRLRELCKPNYNGGRHLVSRTEVDFIRSVIHGHGCGPETIEQAVAFVVNCPNGKAAPVLLNVKGGNSILMLFEFKD